MKKTITIMFALAVFTAVGSYFKIGAVPYIVTASMLIVLGLSLASRLNFKTYPVILYGLALSMIIQQTMLGSYIVGTDIHGEYFIANKTITQGWDFGYFHLNETSLVINVVTPFLHWIGLSVVWQFKLLYPMVLASVPLVLYFAFVQRFDRKIAFYSALFFVIVPVFTIEIAGIVKSMVAEVFFALTVYVLLSNMKYLAKTLLLILFGVLAVMTHYTVGTMIVLYLGIIGAVLVVYGIIKKKTLFVPVLIAVVVIFGIGALWLHETGGSIVYTGYLHSFQSVSAKTVEVSSEPKQVATTDTKPIQNVAKPSEKSYLYQQDTLVQTALGLDFGKVSVWGKIFRVLQYLTEIFIIIGFVVLFIYRKKFKVPFIYFAMVIAYGLILGMVLFVPHLANIINTTRWYHYSLFFISPLLVIGLLKIGKEKLLVGLLAVYYLFTCGLVFTLVSENIPSSAVDVPYSIAYSYQQGIVGISNQDDIDVAKWLVANRQDRKVYVSYPSLYLPLGYEDWYEQYYEKEPAKPYLLFETTQDMELGKWTNGTEPGMRSYKTLPDTSKMVELYREGKAVVYDVR